jgi:hypothetical protein
MNTPTKKETQQIVDRHFDAVQRLRFDQETRRDQLAALISGGALTVSIPFVSSLRDGGQLALVYLLVAAWVLWTSALIGALVGYTMSIWSNQRILEGMSAENDDLDAITPGYAKHIEKVNIGVMVCVASGFVAFGAFALGNLNHGNKEEGKETGYHQIQEAPVELGSHHGELGAGEADGLAAPEAGKGERRDEMNAPRREERGSPPPVPPARMPKPQPTPQQPTKLPLTPGK